ncbi:MAG TPA: hypothetical protein VFB52_06555 [Solirubrobacterales bacterium]|nr:hypothetical protein [Solirubrobacterales bacterium]
MKNVLMVLSNPAEGEDEAYNDWYTNTHLDEVVSIDGFVSARRYKLTDAQIAGFPGSEHSYLAIYEIEGDPADAFAQLVDELQSGRMELPDSIEQATISPWSFEAISERVAASA